MLQQIVQAVDHLGRDCTLPVVNCDSKFKILPKDANLDGKIYETLHDMIKDPHMPKKVGVCLKAQFTCESTKSLGIFIQFSVYMW